ncbi:hypothetical protein A3H77_00155 [Candidatus Kaiserbacteria bacterium RIFCSPLOWO2_02_FULL_56_11]|uniref:TVP38/TMEM64 family membrane protein n=2 Tax=Candidatus Kaiseribacteriota TaxID=1752734 RepID=A0A1F6E5H3_9BACT|nr:MAG: hypothetical protein A3C95_01925 [Candidatus Kaiserbacteria bacterium RIFCSPHIGHO2_02_FULL_56_30]OGG72159.1 MAG: hypothetical protein A3E65_02165 [Candidatus Kaiserbacteria bacterium RIFCSPHIGHO2_12_FULL_56_13]OGG81094.1 MAG: hypothetical protein A3H77_00155 [Candidatus Kaiserbacteria bacterium RIFCSPLOWO2_02_FULL_56_11]
MKRKRDRLLFDLVCIAVSISVTAYIVRSGSVDAVIASLNGSEYFASFVAGALFSSVFTAIPAIALFAELSEHYSLFSIVLTGALGATLADYLLFLFVRDRISTDAAYLLRGRKGQRFIHVIRQRHFYRLFPLIGMVMLISPLPDEPGLALLGVSHISTHSLLVLSFMTHALGILLIVLAVQSAM